MMKALLCLLALLCAALAPGNAQIPPQLGISGTSTGAVEIVWSSESGLNYQLLATEKLESFMHWFPVGAPVTSAGTNAGMLVESAGSNLFFKVHVLNEYAGLPTCRIYSQTNGQVVSGVITISVAAQDDSRISAVDLYMDDVPIGSVTEGSMSFIVNTPTFPNGSHTFVARAQDNVGIPYLGGSANNNTVVNETLSEPVTLDFQNLVRWPNPPVFMDGGLFIEAESDIFPADWTVVVEDEMGLTVRTLSGQTEDGVVQATWDGLDGNDNPVPEEAAYKVTVLVTEASLESQQTFAKAESTLERSATKLNVYGYPDCLIQEPEPAWDNGYSEIYAAWNARSDKDEYPPLPPPVKFEASLPSFRHVPLSDMLLTATAKEPQSAGIMEGGGSGNSGSVKSYVWSETAWSSGKIILARQNYVSGIVGATFNATLGTTLNQVALMINTAANDLPGNRGVFNSTVFVVPTHGAFGVISNNLANPSVRAFYYHGHSDGNAIGFSEGTPNDGITARGLRRGLGNTYTPATNDVLSVYSFRKPFRFVFMDGCLTGRGGFPEAFGIPRAVPGVEYVQKNYKRRAFMGWGSTKQNSIANADFRNWTLKFWQLWVGDDDYEVTLGEAVNGAFQAYPTIQTRAPLDIYGTSVLKWGD